MMRFLADDAAKWWESEHQRLLESVESRIELSRKMPTRISNTWFARTLGISINTWSRFRRGECSPALWWNLRKLLGVRLSPHSTADEWLADECSQLRSVLLARNGSMATICHNYGTPMPDLRRMFHSGGLNVQDFIEFSMMGDAELPRYVSNDVIKKMESVKDLLSDPPLAPVTIPRGLSRPGLGVDHLRVWMALAGLAGEFRRSNARGMARVIGLNADHLLAVLADLMRLGLVEPTDAIETPTIATRFRAATMEDK